MRHQRKKHRKKILYTLLLGEMNSILLALEGDASSLHVIRPNTGVDTGRSSHINYSRTSPTHQRVFPTTGALEDIPVDAPTFRFSRATLHGVARRLVDAYRAMTKLS
jgi:hypothetical protein